MEEVKKKRGRKPLNKEEKPIEVKVLKKRGRKPKIKEEIIEPKQLKKRGRKPKPKKPEELLPKVPKKRGRKPKDKYGFYQKNEVNKLTNHLNDNIILHLPIHSSDIGNNDFDEQSILKYNPNINTPVPYEPSMDDKYMDLSPYPFDNNHEEKEPKSDCSDSHDSESDTNEEISNTTSVKKVDTNTDNKLFDEKKYSLYHENDILNREFNSIITTHFQEVKMEQNNKNKIISDNMNDFKKSNEGNTLPVETNINCWWCCHEFSDTPFVLPIKKVNNRINAIGCFCSAECATSWNFNSDKRNDDIWESYSLLNLLYRKHLNGSVLKIKFAPPRESLIKFGGSLTIEEFRSSNSSYNKKIKNICYPIISLIPQMEEVFMSIADKSNNYIPVDYGRIKKANNDLKLKRNRPVTDPINTLESCMNLKYI